MTEQRQENNNWHLKKEVNIAHVIATVAMFVTCFWFFSDLDKRIITNSTEIIHMKDQRTEDQQRIEKQLDNINKKLDRLIAK